MSLELVRSAARSLLEGYAIDEVADIRVTLANVATRRLDALKNDLLCALKIAGDDKPAAKGTALLIAEGAERALARIVDGTAMLRDAGQAPVYVGGRNLSVGDVEAVHEQATRLLQGARETASAIRGRILDGTTPLQLSGLYRRLRGPAGAALALLAVGGVVLAFHRSQTGSATA